MKKRIERKTNPLLTSLIQELRKQSFENDVQIWKDIAERLEKPASNWAETNLSQIDRNIGEKETALIPGKVLGAGKLTKKVPIAAWDFSQQAKEKIKKAGGKCLTISELIKKNPKGENVRILH